MERGRSLRWVSSFEGNASSFIIWLTNISDNVKLSIDDPLVSHSLNAAPCTQDCRRQDTVTDVLVSPLDNDGRRHTQLVPK
jgi:hypothetical protein